MEFSLLLLAEPFEAPELARGDGRALESERPVMDSLGEDGLRFGGRERLPEERLCRGAGHGAVGGWRWCFVVGA